MRCSSQSVKLGVEALEATASATKMCLKLGLTLVTTHFNKEEMLSMLTARLKEQHDKAIA